MAGRKRIPRETETEVLVRSRRRCCLCFGLNRDLAEKRGQVAHLDRDPSNDSLDNLAYLCFDHHDQYDSRTSQSKGLTVEEVRSYRDRLYEVLGATASAQQSGAGESGTGVTFRVHVDHQSELSLFDDLLHGRREERILLVESPRGLGKTELMLEYRRLACRAGVLCALLDLRDVGTTVFEVLASLYEEWRADCGFQEFCRQVAELCQPTTRVDMHGVLQIGRSEIQMALTGPDEDSRRERRVLLTQALVDDLRRWLGGGRRAVVLVDTYDSEQVTPELRHWMEGALLPGVRRTSGLLAVVAGRHVPQPSVMWEERCYRLYLRPLTNPDDWMVFVWANGIQAPRQVVSAICYTCNGDPLEIATRLSMLRNWEAELWL